MPATKRSGDSARRRRPSARRIRAARAFSGLERPAFAEKSGIDIERLNYLENGKGGASPEEEAAIQRAAGVPLSFLRHGFEPDDGSDLERLDRRVSQLGAVLAQMGDDLETTRVDLAQSVLEVSERLDAAQIPETQTHTRRP